jgi:hypothetical protein
MGEAVMVSLGEHMSLHDAIKRVWRSRGKPSIKQPRTIAPNQIQATAKKLRAKWALTDELLGSPIQEYRTLEEALRNRHAKPKHREVLTDQVAFEKHLVKSLTDQVAADLDKLSLNGTDNDDDNIVLDSISTQQFIPQMRMLSMPRPIYEPKDAKRLFEPKGRYDTLEEALRKRHHKPTLQFPLYSTKDFKPMAMPKLKSNLFTGKIDKLWVK